MNISRTMMLLPCFATLFFLFEFSGRKGVFAESDKDLGDVYKRLYDFGLGKRAAYSYVSEYKRLPVYNFGLGKRASNERLYSFGLGKRDYDLEDEYDEELKEDFAKRGKQYAFGLGKRLPKQYSFGLGKRAEGKMYSFGLGKRSPFPEYDLHNYASEDYDSSEERKRAAPNNDRRFSFGIGKRDAEDERRQERSMHYNFGLGKRSQEEKETAHSSSLVN